LLEILQAKHVDLDVAPVTNNKIAADARFNPWRAGNAKHSFNEERLLELLEIYSDCAVALERATQRFINERAARKELIAVEMDIIQKLKTAME
jgi:hypothetical protein